MSVWGIVVAAGSGSRFGGEKQFADVLGKSVLRWSVDACRAVTDGCVLVVADPADTRAHHVGADLVVAGGATRSESVRAGLSALPAQAEVVVIHDAARPLASRAVFEAVVAAVRSGSDGAVSGIAVVDTIKRVGPGGAVLETVDRTSLVAVQTPQAFKADVLRRAHATAIEGTDDAAVVESIGGRVVVVPGESKNMKITVPSDLEIVRMWASS